MEREIIDAYVKACREVLNGDRTSERLVNIKAADLLSLCEMVIGGSEQPKTE